MIDPERLYSMQEAVYLVPMPSYSALMQFLYKNPRFARVYTRTRIKAVTGAWLTKELAFLRGHQIIEIQKARFHSFEESWYANRAPAVHRGRASMGVLQSIYNAAMG